MRYLRAFYVNKKICGKKIERLEFAPVTIFCGSNDRENTTLLNFICQNLFNEYLDVDYPDAQQDSRLEKFYESVDGDFLEYAPPEDYVDYSWYYNFEENYRIYDTGNPQTLNELNSWDLICGDFHTGKYHSIFETNDSGEIMLPMNTLIERTALMLWDSVDSFMDEDSDISLDMCLSEELNEARNNYADFDLCILDMPELCLSVEEEKKLVEYIEECAYLYRVQFIIATKSPVIASIKEALVYDMDLENVRSVNWKETCIAQQYIDIFSKK